jgi:internalin A
VSTEAADEEWVAETLWIPGTYRPDPSLAAVVQPMGSSGDHLRVRGPWTARIAELWERLGRIPVFYGGSLDASDDDYSWVAGSGVTHLLIPGWVPTDLTPFAEATDLVSLHLGPSKGRLDCSRLVSLESVRTDFSIIGFEHLPRLRDLSLRRWAEPDLSRLASLKTLERLWLSGAMGSIEGTDALTNLRELELQRTPKISSLASFASNPALEILSVWSAGSLRDIGSVAEATSLQNLSLANCRSIATLAPLRGHPALKWLSLAGSTDVADGDLTPLLDIPTLEDCGVEFYRKSYQPGVELVRRTLHERHGIVEAKVTGFTVEHLDAGVPVGQPVVRAHIRVHWDDET